MKLTLVLISSLLFTLSLNVLGMNFNPVKDLNEVEELKAEILKIAEYYQGQADQNQAIQNTLVPYVDKLLKVSPQPPVEDRLEFLNGRWQQVWGPYEYRKYDRSVDPTLDTSKIYQVVFKEGYYYNVSNVLDKDTGKSSGTTLLRGKFKLGGGVKLPVRFTSLKRIKTFPPRGLSYTDLAELAENDQLDGLKKVLPNFIVRLFFGKGVLNEVYTDETLRITYGTAKKADAPFLYILKRVP